MTNPILGPITPSGASLAELDARARDILRRIVETYLETGDPVGSRTISRGGVHLSPASIRNTMQDLTELGLLGAPHASAGRMPTHAGLRLFVDGLLEIGDISEEDRRSIEARLSAHGRSFDDALNEASAILSGLAGGAGVVVTPIREAGVKHVEFVALGQEKTLAIMVFEDGIVENRLMRRTAGVTPSALQEASNFLNSRLRGKTLIETAVEMAAEIANARSELDAAAAGPDQIDLGGEAALVARFHVEHSNRGGRRGDQLADWLDAVDDFAIVGARATRLALARIGAPIVMRGRLRCQRFAGRRR